RARDMYDQLGDRLSAANTTRNIGVLYGELGDAQRSDALIRSALATARDLKNPIFEEVFLASLAPAERVQGRLQDALHDYERILALDDTNKLTGGRVEVLGQLATLQSDLGQHDRALASAREALTLARASSYKQAEAAMLGGIGKELRLLGKPQEALPSLVEA